MKKDVRVCCPKTQHLSRINSRSEQVSREREGFLKKFVNHANEGMR